MPSILIGFIKREILQKRNAWVLGLGALAGLGASALLPSALGLILLWVAMGVWLWRWKQLSSIATTAISAFCWGIGYYGVLLLWMWAIHPLAWMGFSPPLSLVIAGLGWMIAVSCQSLIVCAVFTLTTAMVQRLEQKWLADRPTVSWFCRSVLLSMLWAYGLWWLNEQPLRMPWGFMAYAHADVILVRTAAAALTFWGLEAVLMLLMQTTSVLAESLIVDKRLSRPGLVVLMVALLILTTAARFHPAVLKAVDAEEEGAEKTVIPVLVQSNITIETEHEKAFDAPHVYRPLLKQALDTLKPGERDRALVIFPEGIELYAPLNAMTICGTRSCPVAMLTGGVVWRPKAGVDSLTPYNAVLGYNAGSSKAVGAIDKRPLVAFGEKIPFVRREWVTSIMKPLSIDYGESFSEGESGQSPLALKLSPHQTLRVGGLICFEALYPTIVRQYKQQGVDVLVTVGNLGWFHHHPMIEPQFMRFNQFRAAESAKPLVLVTNTGTSAVIDATGAIRLSLPSATRQVKRGPVLHLY